MSLYSLGNMSVRNLAACNVFNGKYPYMKDLSTLESCCPAELTCQETRISRSPHWHYVYVLGLVSLLPTRTYPSVTTSWMFWLTVFASDLTTLELLADDRVVTCRLLWPISRSSTVTWIKSIRHVASQALRSGSRQTYRLTRWKSFQKCTSQIDGVSSSTCRHRTRLASMRALIETCVHYLIPALTSLVARLSVMHEKRVAVSYLFSPPGNSGKTGRIFLCRLTDLSSCVNHLHYRVRLNKEAIADLH